MLRLIDPVPQLTDRDGPTGLRRLPREVILPVMSEDEVGRVEDHLPELEGVGDAPHQRPEGLVHRESVIAATGPPR